MTDNPQPGGDEPAGDELAGAEDAQSPQVAQDPQGAESPQVTDPPSASWLDPEYSSGFWSSSRQAPPDPGAWGDPAGNPWDSWRQGGAQQAGWDAYSGGWGAGAGWGGPDAGAPQDGWDPRHGWNRRPGSHSGTGWRPGGDRGARGGWGTGGWGPDGWWQGPWDPASPTPGSRGPATGRVGRLISVVLAIGLIAAVAVAGAVHLQPGHQSASTNLGGSSAGGAGGRFSGPATGGPFGAPSAGNPRTNPADVRTIGNKVSPELVDINTTLSYSQEEAAGTGIVLDSGGEILTNNHVIDGETSLRVTDIGNGKTYGGTVIGYDHTNDIAVIQLTGASGLPIATLGDSSSLTTGESVVAIGNAGGAGGQPSVAGGSISLLDQSITASDEGGGSTEQLDGLIESSTDIQPGDSGGALVDMSGHVIGVDTAAADAFGVGAGGPHSEGYAIPINRAIQIARSIVAGKGSSTIHVGPSAFLGVEVEGASSSVPGQNGLGPGSTGQSGSGQSGSGQGGSGQGTGPGVTIKKAFAHGAAADAGLTTGDTITMLGTAPVASSGDLTSLLEGYHPGQSVSVGYVDGQGQSRTASVTLQSGPPS